MFEAHRGTGVTGNTIMHEHKVNGRGLLMKFEHYSSIRETGDEGNKPITKPGKGQKESSR